jgi:intracellular sulfur oxidation DsrE/DsrF family protein
VNAAKILDVSRPLSKPVAGDLTMRVTLSITLTLGCLLLLSAIALADGPTFVHPLIPKFGAMVALPKAAEQPRSGVKVVFDLTADSKPAEVNKGLESVARYLNLNSHAGYRAADVKLAVVLHGGATKAVLADAAFHEHTSEKQNPNLELLRELKKQGVEVFVCGQSLARNKFAADQVDPSVTVAVSAMTVAINRQQAGYAYMALH